jgi:hypothetical protein
LPKQRKLIPLVQPKFDMAGLKTFPRCPMFNISQAPKVTIEDIVDVDADG